MKHLKKSLALVLVLAMTISMLPVFAAAEDVAVETVTPVADVPAAEPAPAVETIAPVAVEDVSFIPELPQAEAPAAAPVEAIETVAAEEVKAELQAIAKGAEYADDAAALAAGCFLKLYIKNVGTYYYNNFEDASTDNKNTVTKDNTSTLTLLCDYTYYDETVTTTGIIGASSTGTLAYTTFNLGGKTLTVRAKRPVLSRGSTYSVGSKLTGGTLIYQNLGTTARRSVIYSYYSTMTQSNYTTVCYHTAAISNMTCISLAPLDGGYPSPILYTDHWTNTVNVTNSKLISVGGSAIEFAPISDLTSSSANAATQIKSLRTKRTSAVNLSGACVVGSLADAPAISYTYPTLAKEQEITTGLTVAADGEKKSVFLGSAIVGIPDEPENAALLTKTLPADYTDDGVFRIALPDPNSLHDSNSYAETVQPTYLRPNNYPSIVSSAHPHTIEHVAEDPATTTYTGVKEHYACPVCGATYQDAEGTIPATEEWLTINMLGCDHAAKEHLALQPATYVETGFAECWYCPTCETYWDAADENVTTAEVLTIPLLNEETDASGYSDSELVAMGAVMKVTAPDGSVTARTTIGDAVSTAAGWTESGGEIKLLADYTVKSNSDGNTGLLWNTGENASKYHTDSDPLVGTLYGFWIDLGGHTLTAWRPSSLFGRQGNTAVNIKNGTIIYLNADTNPDHSAGVFKAAVHVGTSSAKPYDPETHEMLTGRITLYNAKIFSLPGGTVSYPMLSMYWDSVIRLYDSVAIGGYGLAYAKCEDTVEDAVALTNIQAHGLTNNLYLYGNTVLGSNVNNRQLTFRTWAAASGNKADSSVSPYEGIDHSINVYADPTARFVGSTAGMLATGNVGTKFPLAVNTPEGCDKLLTTYEITMPNKTSVTSAEKTTVGLAPAYNENPSNLNAYYYTPHVHGVTSTPTHVEAVAATYTAAGNTEYWACTCGKFFSDETLTTEIEEGSWVIPMLTCEHASKEAHAAVAATYAAAGNSAYWYCPTCEKYFSDEECTTEIEKDSWVLAKLVDATGKTDDELIEQGAYFKATAPGGASVKAYADILSAYAEANSWTEAGGELLLLTDYELVYSKVETSGYIQTLPGADAYDNNEEADMPVKGFWLDLGTHTMSVQLGQALYYAVESVSVNIKNGTLVYKNIGRDGSSYWGIITFGTSKTNTIDGNGAVRTPTVNLKNVQMFALAPKAGKDNTSIVASTIWNTTVNVKDSTLISESDHALKFKRSSYSPTDENLAIVQASGVNYIVNVSGTSTIGSLAATGAAISTTPNGGEREGVAHNLNVNASEKTAFIGTVIHNNSEAAPATATGLDAFLDTTRSYTFPAISSEAMECKTWVYPAEYVATDLADQQTDAGSDKATLTYGTETVHFAEISNALAAAEKLGANAIPTAVTLNAAATETYTLGTQGTSSFTLDLNGQAVPENGLFEPVANDGETVTVTLASAGTAKLFAHAKELTFDAGDTAVIQKKSLFTNYSLNLEDSVSVNLYTDGDNGYPDSVYYMQSGKEHEIKSHGEEHDWIVNTLAAKQMDETITAYAVKDAGTTILVDVAKDVSIKGYVSQDPAAGITDETLQQTLTETLQTMQIYGKYAEKFFNNDFDALDETELTALIGVGSAPANYVSQLDDGTFAISDIANHVDDNTVQEGYYGSAAVLADRLSLKFYFYGDQFANTATVTIGGETVEYTPKDSVDGNYKYVEASVSAKDFDTAITVAFAGVGSVTDSISNYTKRIEDKGPEYQFSDGKNAYNLALALRAYGAAAKAYGEAKNNS